MLDGPIPHYRYRSWYRSILCLAELSFEVLVKDGGARMMRGGAAGSRAPFLKSNFPALDGPEGEEARCMLNDE